MGAYSNRARRLHRPQEGEPASVRPAPRPDEDDELASTVARRRSLARLLRRIHEVDPLVCPRCGGEPKIVAVITDPVGRYGYRYAWNPDPAIDVAFYELKDKGELNDEPECTRACPRGGQKERPKAT